MASSAGTVTTMTSSLLPSVEPYVGEHIPEAARVVFIILGILYSVVGVVGNIFIIVIIVLNKTMRNPHYFFIVNLAVADLVLTGYVLPHIVLSFILRHYPVVNFNHCIFNGFTTVLSYVASLLTLMVISLNRYLSVCHHQLFNRLFSHKLLSSVIGCVVIWFLSILCTMPGLIGWGRFVFDLKTHYCGYDRTYDYNYTLFIILFSIGLPVVVVFACNFAIWRFVRRASHRIYAFTKGKAAGRNNARVGEGFPEHYSQYSSGLPTGTGPLVKTDSTAVKEDSTSQRIIVTHCSDASTSTSSTSTTISSGTKPAPAIFPFPRQGREKRLNDVIEEGGHHSSSATFSVPRLEIEQHNDVIEGGDHSASSSVASLARLETGTQENDVIEEDGHNNYHSPSLHTKTMNETLGITTVATTSPSRNHLTSGLEVRGDCAGIPGTTLHKDSGKDDAQPNEPEEDQNPPGSAAGVSGHRLRTNQGLSPSFSPFPSPPLSRAASPAPNLSRSTSPLPVVASPDSPSGPITAHSKNKREKNVLVTPEELALIKTLFVVFISFAVFMSPYMISTLVDYQDRWPAVAHITCTFSAFTNCCLNCVLYGLLTPAFKKAYLKLMPSLGLRTSRHSRRR